MNAPQRALSEGLAGNQGKDQWEAGGVGGWSDASIRMMEITADGLLHLKERSLLPIMLCVLSCFLIDDKCELCEETHGATTGGDATFSHLLWDGNLCVKQLFIFTCSAVSAAGVS